MGQVEGIKPGPRTDYDDERLEPFNMRFPVRLRTELKSRRDKMSRLIRLGSEVMASMSDESIDQLRAEAEAMGVAPGELMAAILENHCELRQRLGKAPKP